MSMEERGGETDGAAPEVPALHASSLWCDTCGRSTPHRILHLTREAGRSTAGSPRAVHGVARCRTCQTVHPFSTQPPGRDVEVAEVLSVGARSTRRNIRLPRGRRLQVGSGVPDSDLPVVVRAIDRHDGRRVPTARAEEIATVWAERERPPAVAVSVIEGRRTVTTTLPVSGDPVFTVGQPLRIQGVPLRVQMLRARGENWRRPGDAFRASEIQRLYARRTFTPPAGRRDWRAERERPVARASSISRSGRSRSSPGVRRKRTEPRARSAD